ncbi:MAG: hypothetical protein HKN54_04225 [Flavobacteriaceae bacterium]|nr:hypothetical protein [Flavobacteriaceae bacterium]
MKRLIRSVLILTLFLFSTQLSHAQNMIEINQSAAETTAELKKEVKFNAEQEDRIYESYVLYHKKLVHIDKMSSANPNSALEEKKKVYTELCDNLKKILNKEQFARFEAIEKYKSE